MNDTLKYVYFKAVCNYICTPTPMYIIPLKIDSSLLFLSGLPICLFYQYRYICAKMSDADATSNKGSEGYPRTDVERAAESKQNNENSSSRKILKNRTNARRR